MPTRLDKTLKRELEIDGRLYTVTIGPDGLKIALKGARKGREISWRDLASGDEELRQDLSVSTEAYRPPQS